MSLMCNENLTLYHSDMYYTGIYIYNIRVRKVINNKLKTFGGSGIRAQYLYYSTDYRDDIIVKKKKIKWKNRQWNSDRFTIAIFDGFHFSNDLKTASASDDGDYGDRPAIITGSSSCYSRRRDVYNCSRTHTNRKHSSAVSDVFVFITPYI